MQPQDFKIWVGAELLGCTRGYQKKVLNAVTYIVKDVVDGQVQLSMAPEFRGEDAEGNKQCTRSKSIGMLGPVQGMGKSVVQPAHCTSGTAYNTNYI